MRLLAAGVRVSALSCTALAALAAEGPAASDTDPDTASWRDSLQVTTRIGTESWRVDYMGVKASSTRKDELHMPDGSLSWPYRDISPWMTVQASYEVNSQIQLMGKFMANQSFGGRIDELAVNYAVSPYLGVRAGVVDFKMSWCKDYDVNNGWIQDPNQFCSEILNKRMTAAGPGVQTYLNFHVANYQVQTVAGAYSPKIFSYDDTENGRNGNPNNRPTDRNDKIGLALNVLNLSDGTELRASWLYTDLQITGDRALEEGWPVEMQKDHTFYLAVEKPLTRKLTGGLYVTRSLKVTDLRYYDFPSLRYETWTNLSGITAEISYAPAPSHRLLMALSKFEAIKRYTGIWDGGLSVDLEEENTYLFHNVLSLSWHKEWAKNIATTVQWKRVVYLPSFYAQSPPVWSGNALGIRLGYTF